MVQRLDILATTPKKGSEHTAGHNLVASNNNSTARPPPCSQGLHPNQLPLRNILGMPHQHMASEHGNHDSDMAVYMQSMAKRYLQNHNSSRSFENFKRWQELQNHNHAWTNLKHSHIQRGTLVAKVWPIECNCKPATHYANWLKRMQPTNSKSNRWCSILCCTWDL